MQWMGKRFRAAFTAPTISPVEVSVVYDINIETERGSKTERQKEERKRERERCREAANW